MNDGKGIVYPVTETHIMNPNRFWTLGGSQQGNVLYDPVSGKEVIMGRGLDDDRGPGVSMLYGMAALRDAEVPLRSRIRAVFGTTEDSNVWFNSAGLVGSGGFIDMRWYTMQDEWPIMGTTSDSGVAPVMYVNSGAAWTPIVRVSWDNTPTTLGLRFPNVLTFEDTFTDGSISAPMTYGTGIISGDQEVILPPAARPSFTYNQARETHRFKSYFAGQIAGTGSGQNLLQAAWLVMPNSQSASALLTNARALRNSYMMFAGGWEYPIELRSPERATTVPVRLVPLANRWETGIEVELVSPDTVQIVTKGHTTRFWEMHYFSPRHLMLDFLSKITLPAGVVAPWQPEIRKFMEFYPFDGFRENRVWNAQTLFGTHARVYTGILSNIASLTPIDYSVTGGAADGTRWQPRLGTAWRNYSFQGRNDVNLTGLDIGIRINYSPTPAPEGYTTFIGTGSGARLSNAFRARAGELGLRVTTTGDAGNATATPYTTPDSDVLLKTLRGYNAFNWRFRVPDNYAGLEITGPASFRGYREVRQERPMHIAGGTYAVSFQPRANTNYDGRLVATGGWGGTLAPGTLHGWNERVPVDGMFTHAQVMARVFAEFAAGVPHTWVVSGNGRTQVRPKDNLAYVGSADVYIWEEATAKPVIENLYAQGRIHEPMEILFARKFKMTNLMDYMTVKAELLNNNQAKIRLFAVQADTVTTSNRSAFTTFDVNMNPHLQVWHEVASGEGIASFAFAPGSIFDMTPPGTHEAEVAIIALVESRFVPGPTPIKPPPGEEPDPSCNVGFAAVALLLLPFIVRRRK